LKFDLLIPHTEHWPAIVAVGVGVAVGVPAGVAVGVGVRQVRFVRTTKVSTRTPFT